MFKKFNILLILSLLIFISVSAVSAVEDGDVNLTSDEVHLDTIEVSDIQDEVSLDEESNLNTVEEENILTSNEYTVTSSNYGTYFDDNGNVKSIVNSGDTIKLSGSFSSKKFIFNKTVNVVGENSDMKNSIVTLLNGASGSIVSNLKIINTNEETYGIFLNGVSNCLVKQCNIDNNGRSSYPICVGNNANYNNITDNHLKTSGVNYGHGTRSTPALVLSGSHYNTLSNNFIEVDDANAIYLSVYNGGPLNGGNSNYNLIFNNTIHYNVVPTSWSYAIQIMGDRNTIKSNKIIGAYRGISTTGYSNIITENRIINLTGADYNNNFAVVGGEYGIVGSSNSIITNNYIENARIISTGAGIRAIDNSVVENNNVQVISKGMGIRAEGADVEIKNNNISTESGVGVYEKDNGYGLKVTNNNISSSTAIGVLIEKINSKSMPSDVTITYNDILTGNEYAIDASGVEEGTGVIENNNVHGKKIKFPSGEYDDSKPTYKYNESQTYIINSSNIRDYINDNGNLVGVDDGAIIKFQGTFSNEVINVNKAIKILGENAVFLNSTFKVTSGGVWIENLTIINKKAERINAWGIYVNGANGVKIIGNTINVTDPNAAYAIYVLESRYVEVINNTLISDGELLTFTLLVYSSDDCIFELNKITTIGTGEVYRYDNERPIDGKSFMINGTEVCVDGNELCIDGTTYCLDGNELCIDGVTYCLDGNEFCIDGVAYSINGNEFCIDGTSYCLDGNTLYVNKTVYCLDGQTECIDGVTYSVNGTEFCIDGVTYCLDGNELCIDGTTYCLDGNELCIDGTTYCLDGSGELCIDGVTYCLDGSGVIVNGNVYNSHIVPEIYRTYGILLLYSSGNAILNNDVHAESKLNKTYPAFGLNSSQNSIVGIDIYYNSHNNTVSNNFIYVWANDNYLYGLGVLGSMTGHQAPEGQGASNNEFIGNIIELYGPFVGTGIIIGFESTGTLAEDNNIYINTTVSYGINLEQSQNSTLINNNLILKSDVNYGIEVYTSSGNVIKGNNINATGKSVYGIIVSGSNNEIKNNAINASGNGENVTFDTGDKLGVGNGGIILFGNSTENNLISNNIVSLKGFAITAEAGGNTIEDNYLISEMGNGTAGINATSGNTIKGNYMYLIDASFPYSSVPYLEEARIVLVTNTNLDGAKVKFYNGERGLIGEATVIDGNATLKITFPADFVVGSYPISAIISKEDHKTTEFESMLVIRPGNLNVHVSNISVKPGLKAKYSVKVTNALGNPVSGLTVDFRYFTFTSQIAFSGKTDKNGNLNLVEPFDKAFASEDIVEVCISVIDKTNTYSSASAICNVTVLDAAPITIKINSKLSFNAPLAKITDNNGFAVVNKQVTVKIDGKSHTLRTDSNGEVILPTVKAGSHSVTVSSSKDSTYAAGSASSKVTVVATISGNKNANVYFGNTVQYKIRIADKNGNYLGANKFITIKVNGKSHKIKTNKNGYATYNIKKIGTYTVTAQYNGYKVSNKIVIKPTLIAKNIIKKKAKKIKFSAKLVNKKGKILKNKKVTFKVNGKKYTPKTNKKGIATVSIKNLKVGKYKITSSYGGCTVKNTITIKK